MNNDINLALVRLLNEAHQLIGKLKNKVESYETEACLNNRELVVLQNRLERIKISDLESIMRFSGNKIHAIRLYRAISNQSLRESKEYVDQSSYWRLIESNA